MQSYTIGKNEAGQRLDKFLNKFMPAAGSSFLYKMLRKKNIVLNTKKAEGKEILAVGDTVSFFFSDETFLKFTGRDTSGVQNEDTSAYQKAYGTLKGIEVIYKDENILILNKPAGVLSQQAEKGQDSLNEWMIGYLLENGKIDSKSLSTFKPSVLNRLDRNTSGLVICGISLKGSQTFSKLIHDRSIGKYYVTIVKGKIDKPGMITGSLTKDEKTNKVTIHKDGGDQIKTAYKPLSHGKDYTYLEVDLITGKTHQIRAHMASMGHPILGDVKYGDASFNKKYADKHIKYQLLHAYRVEIPKMEGDFAYLSGKTFHAPIPKVFKEVLN